ncbi:MAG TPA: SgcJ/EcaC family oxidoreductase [Verrucomicrobiae bacterium]|nr:SgcJ/EcaC family oxidoreductase [Verrucomicrobiae bacterium]
MLKLVAICSVLLPLVAYGQSGKVEDQKDIRAVVDQFMDAWNLHDAHAFGGVFSEDADLTNWRGTGASGRSKIEETHAPMFATVFKKSHQKYSDIKTRFIRDDVAAVDVHWQMTGVMDAHGEPRPDREGLLSFVMAKDAARWQIVVMYNLDLSALPPPPK